MKKIILFGISAALLIATVTGISSSAVDVVGDNCYIGNEGYILMDVPPEEAEIVGKNYVTGEIEYQKLIVDEPLLCGEGFEYFHQGYTPIGSPDPSADVSVTGVIGEDGRVMVSDLTVMPYSAVALVNTTWDDGTNSFGTAWFVSKNVLVTAAHVVHDSSGWATTVTVMPGVSVGSYPYGTHTPTNIYTTTAWIQSGQDYTDYAVIILGSDVGNETGWFSMRALSNAANQSVVITGYKQRYYQHRMGGITTAHTPGGMIRYQIDTSGGQSGAPVYCSGNVVIGIHTAGIYYYDSDGNKVYVYNEGVAINEGVYSFIMGYVNAND